MKLKYSFRSSEESRIKDWILGTKNAKKNRPSTREKNETEAYVVEFLSGDAPVIILVLFKFSSIVNSA